MRRIALLEGEALRATPSCVRVFRRRSTRTRCGVARRLGLGRAVNKLLRQGGSGGGRVGPRVAVPRTQSVLSAQYREDRLCSGNALIGCENKEVGVNNFQEDFHGDLRFGFLVSSSSARAVKIASRRKSSSRRESTVREETLHHYTAANQWIFCVVVR